jgi:hypothetical protein
MRIYVYGFFAALAIGAAAGLFTWLLDDQAPTIFLGGFFATIAFILGAAGRQRMGAGPPEDTIYRAN